MSQSLGSLLRDPIAPVEAYLHMRKSRALTSTDVETLQRHTFYGKEKKPLPCLLGRMNMILHGVSTPDILRTNTLDEDVRRIPAEEFCTGVKRNAIWAVPSEPGLMAFRTRIWSEGAQFAPAATIATFLLMSLPLGL